MNNNPAILSGLILGVGNALLAVVVIMGWWQLSNEQIGAWNGLLVALAAMLTWWMQTRMVDTKNLRSEDGSPVTPKSVRDGQPVHDVNWNK